MLEEQTKKPERPRFYEFDEYLKLPRLPSKWLIEGLIPAGLTNLFANPKIGKALDVATPILTTAGWKALGVVQPGDYVFGSTGAPIRVKAVSPVWQNRPSYEVTFSDRTTVVADAEHEWSVRHKSRSHLSGVRTTYELLSIGLSTKSNQWRKSEWDVALGQAIELPEQMLPLDPYCFGLWLGDGTQSNSQLTSADAELVQAWEQAGFTVTKQPSNPYGYGIKGLKLLLHSFNVLNNKHVPECYLMGSVEQRKELLMGLMDTDGCASGTASFSNTNEKLSDAVVYLARSLGYRATKSQRVPKCNGKACAIDYRVNIVAHEHVFKLARKREAQRLNVTERYRSIKSITPVAPRATVCIEVDAPDHLFCAGTGMVLTHNSFLAMGICEAIVSGAEEYEGFKVHQHGPVAFLQIDTNREEWGGRYDVVKERLKGRKYPFFTADMWTVPAYPFNLLRDKKSAVCFDENNKPVTEDNWLKEELERIKPILLVVDTLRDMHEEDEDKSGAMRRVLGTLYGIVGRECSIIIISHSRKDSQFTTNDESDIMQGGRGSNAVAGKVDMVIRMTKQEIHTKGRAQGFKKYSYHQLPKDGIDEGRIVFDAEKKEAKGEVHDMIKMLVENNPNMTQSAIAAKLAAITHVSERTAHRRIQEWQTQQAARLKAVTRLQQEVEATQPEFLHLPNGNRVHLATGEEIPPELKSPPKRGLWNEPLNL